MERSEALEILEQYQLWRRGEHPYDQVGYRFEYGSKVIGEAIDVAIEELKR